MQIGTPALTQREQRRVRAAQFLTLLPNFIRPDLMADDAFRSDLGLNVEGSVYFGACPATFRRNDFFQTVERLYANTPKSLESLKADDGSEWTVEQADDVAAGALRLKGDGSSFLIQSYFGLKATAEERLDGFDAELAAAGLTIDDLPDWREILRSRTLSPAEVGPLSDQLSVGPVAVLDAIRETLDQPSFDLPALVPAELAYYERLVGRPAATVVELAEQIAPTLVARFLKWDVLEGARLALALSCHATIFRHVDWSSVDAGHYAELVTWALGSDDLISKVGAVEIALPHVAMAPELEASLLALVQQICSADDGDDGGQLRLLTAMFMLVEGELLRTGVLREYRPFQRRLASLAHASLLIREVPSRVDIARFSQLALETRGRAAYLQSHIDLRLEPRWLPDYVYPSHLKAELIGRLRNAVERSGGDLPEGPLRDFLVGTAEDRETLSKYIVFPSSYAPGPLEGGSPAVDNPLAPQFRKFLESLSDDGTALEPTSLIALINLQGVYTIDPIYLEHAVKRIEVAGHRFTASTDDATVKTLLDGLACVASATRNPALAQQVRILCRKRRFERPDTDFLRKELLIALIGAGAHSELEEWLKFAAAWIEEIAFAMPDKAQAGHMLNDLKVLCLMEPRLRPAIGRTMAGLDLFARA